MTEPTKHSILSPSSMGRWQPCPGSAREIVAAGCPDKPSVHSATGTLAHTISEAALQFKFGWRTKQSMFAYSIDTKHEVDGFKITVTRAMLEAVEIYVDFVLDVVKTHRLDPKKHVSLEQKLNLPGLDYDGQPRFGKGDCIIQIPYKRLLVIDYKNGAGVAVDVEDNVQALSYALGALESLPDYVRDEIPEVELVIIQPNRPTGSPIQSQVVPVDRIWQFRWEMLRALEIAVTPDAPLVAGDWCHKYFCPIRTSCPAASAYASRSAGLRAEDDFKHVVAAQVQAALPAPANLTNEKIADLLQGRDYVDKWFNAIAAEALARAEEGQEIPGHHLEEKFGHEAWTDADHVTHLLRANEDVDFDIHAEAKLLTPTQMKKALKKAKVEIDLSEYIARPHNGKALKAGDARPSAEDDFKGVTIDA